MGHIYRIPSPLKTARRSHAWPLEKSEVFIQPTRSRSHSELARDSCTNAPKNIRSLTGECDLRCLPSDVHDDRRYPASASAMVALRVLHGDRASLNAIEVERITKGRPP